MSNRFRRVLTLSIACAGAAALAGCSGYWKVTDTRHGDDYYSASKPRPNPETGLVRFVDADTGAIITLDAYAIERAKRGETAQPAETAVAGHPEG